MRVLLPLLFLIFTSHSFAVTAEEAAILSDRARQGYVDSDISLRLEIFTDSGRKKSKYIRIRQKEHVVLDDNISGEASLIIFGSKNCARSMAILTIKDNRSAPRQWMFLPALQKVRTISARSKGGALSGSEFSFEELTGHTLGSFRYEGKAKDITYKGRSAWQFTRYQKEHVSQYRKELVIIDSTTYLPHKIDYYDHQNTLFKTLTLEGYDDVGKTGYFKRATMTNHRTDDHSVVTLLKIYSDTRLNTRQFDPLYLTAEMVEKRCIQ